MVDQPNILLFVSDDHAQWACPPYGNAELRTPNLDGLAISGVTMESAFTPTPVCSAARASLLTGLMPSQHGIHDYIASAFDRGPWLAEERTLPRLLQEAGYRTGLAGKWHLGNEDRPAPGFEFWFSTGSSYPLLHSGARQYCNQGRMETVRGYTDEVIADQAARFLGAADGRPWFLLVGLTATHSPWGGHPDRLVDLYREAGFPGIPRGEFYPFGEQAQESLGVDRSAEQEARAQYYAAVTHIDEIVGRLLGVVGESGEEEETLVVYTSDHGLNCGHHGIWGKGNGTFPLNMVEESIRVPMVLRWPGVLPAARRCKELVDHLDLFQTLAAAGRVALPSNFDYPGESLMPLLVEAEGEQRWRQIQYGEYGPTRMARSHRHKLVRRYGHGSHELFDLEADGRECSNIFGEAALQDVTNHLSEQIEAYFDRFTRPGRSGLLGAALPQLNMTEAWRR